MIRVVFVSSLVYNYFCPGKVRQAGGQTPIYNLSRSFASKKEYEVFCLVGNFGQPDRVVLENVTLVKSQVDNPLAVFQVIRTLNLLKPDIILDFCASPRLFIYACIKRFLSTKTVFLTGSDIDVNGDYKKIENPVYDFFYRIGLKQTDAIIAQVPLHVKLLKEKLGLKSYLILSPYLEIQRSGAMVKDSILWVGRAAFYKRPELFVRLVLDHPEEKFIMICNDSPYDNGFMDNIKKKLSALQNIEFHDYVAYPEMAYYYSRAKLLVNTSDFEGFPNTFIEAAVKQCPVLSLNSDPNQMLSVHGGGQFCNGDFEAMRRCLKLLLNDKNKLRNLGKRNFDYALRFHRIDSAVSQLDKIFKQTLWRN
ncbi:glycosyltransferase family 4 protein [uncultured Desulfobacter sp.]|uniref:glycosyltransferase family 4 protein n=1 Tax=uncultured Desulfobacter sp. TaxID=240139 RepID=UPI002AAC0B91|nr:glycosyltransferase family 4 protein [uncultured Desulfobacter sp.]